jgi:hypothetical protein
MKNFIKKKLKSILCFIELHFSLKIANKNPLDIYHEELSKYCYNFFKQHMKSSSIFLKDKDIRKYSVFNAFKNKSNMDNLFLEFGVWKGSSINLFAKFLSQHGLNIYGFDSFEGLEEEWITNEYHPIGTFGLNQKKPKVLNNVQLIKGKVQKTLENFLSKNSKKKIIFVHMDMDTYVPTKFTLTKIKPLLQKGSIILFDEFYGFPNWEKNEYKAFTEVFNEKEYKYLAFCTRQVAIEIL